MKSLAAAVAVVVLLAACGQEQKPTVSAAQWTGVAPAPTSAPVPPAATDARIGTTGVAHASPLAAPAITEAAPAAVTAGATPVPSSAAGTGTATPGITGTVPVTDAKP